MGAFLHDDDISSYIAKGYFTIDEGRIYYSNGKSYLYSHPEEKVRAWAIGKLIDQYKYPKQAIDTEVHAPQRSIRNPADIVVYNSSNMNRAFIVVETKANDSPNDIETGKREALGNANLLNAKYMLVVACNRWLAYDATGAASNVDALVKFQIADIPVRYGKTPQYRYRKGGGEGLDLSKSTYCELNSIFKYCHDQIWDGGKLDPSRAFDEFSKLLITKLHDETYTRKQYHYSFQFGTNETVEEVSSRIVSCYEKVKRQNPAVFKEGINLRDIIISNIVKCMEGISLRNTDLDAKGRAIEKFLGKYFRGEYGQYFTPRQVVEFMVGMTDPKADDYVIDPACGSGGFLLYTMRHVAKKAKQDYLDDIDSIRSITKDFSHKHIFGIEINERIARVAMMDMIVHEDGHTNIGFFDALDNFESLNGNLSYKITPDKYDLLLTNPPFSQRIKKGDKQYYKDYYLAKKSNGSLHKSQMVYVFFIERAINLIRHGGRIAIVVPDSAITNKANVQVIEFLKVHCRILAVISLPVHTFAPVGTDNTKTSILLLEKGSPKESYPVFMAHVDHVGYDSNGKLDSNDLPMLLNEWLLYRDNELTYPTYKTIGQDLWVSKVDSSNIRNKLDVDAYDENYNKINQYFQQPSVKTLPLSSLVKNIFSGISPKITDYVADSDAGYTVIKTANIEKIAGNIGIINWQNVKYVDKQKFLSKKKVLKINDILVQSVAHIKNYIADKIAIVDQLDSDHVLALSKFLIIRPDVKKVNPRYLMLYFASDFGKIQINRMVRGMSAQIYDFDFSNLIVVLPNRSEQDKMVLQYEQLLFDRGKAVSDLKNIESSMLSIIDLG